MNGTHEILCDIVRNDWNMYLFITTFKNKKLQYDNNKTNKNYYFLTPRCYNNHVQRLTSHTQCGDVFNQFFCHESGIEASCSHSSISIGKDQ